VSGLINAIELSMAGHHVTVYEASDRLGGRILTHRMTDEGFITELGAMRLPLKQHPLTNIYVTERYKLKVAPFRGYDSNALFYINGRRRTFNERIVPDENGFDVYGREKNKVGRLLLSLSLISFVV
jgi:monoamine oxidase